MHHLKKIFIVVSSSSNLIFLSSFTMPAVVPLLPSSVLPDYKHYTPEYNLDDLVRDIKAYLGTSGGISSAEVDNEYLISLAQKYISDPNDWARYFYNDTSKNYTRNAIENINLKANIVCCFQDFFSILPCQG